jgi:AcrR family transcriptional regulator
LLAAANELFYEEGVHTVGIERVLERAGVAKASLYDAFGSKEGLVREYLERRALTRKERILERIARHESPRDRVLAIFDLLGELATVPGFRGCAFVNACAEGPRGPTAVRRVAAEQRQWIRELFARLTSELGAADPARTGRQLALLYDGAVIGAAMDSDPEVAREARAIAERLLDAVAADPARAKRSRKRRSRDS